MMNTLKPQTSTCQFMDLANGIWLFAFSEANNRAVDEWYEWQSHLKATVPQRPDRRVRMILDVRASGPLPLLYTLQQGREWRKQYTDLHTIRVQIAVLMKDFPAYQQPYIKLIKDGVNIFTGNQVEVEVFFEEQQYAIDWLLQP